MVFEGITLNNGKELKFGSVVQWANPSLTGANPINEQIPSILTFADYKTELDNKPRTDIVWDRILGQQFANQEELAQFLYDNGIQDASEQVIWLAGDYTNGGILLANNGSTTSCRIIVWSPVWESVDPETPENSFLYIYINSRTVNYYATEGLVPVSRPVSWVFFNYYSNSPGTTDLIPPVDFGVSFYESSLPTWYIGTDEYAPNPDNPEQYIWIQTDDPNQTTWDIYLENWTNNFTQDYEILDHTNHPWELFEQFRTPRTSVFYLDVMESENNRRVSGAPLGGALIDEEGNPYGGTFSDAGGGDGTHSLGSDSIGGDGLPNSAVLSSGICRIYLPDATKTADFMNFLFNDFTDTMSDKVKKLFTNPIESILSFNVCHINIPYSASAPITFAGIDSGVTSPYANNQYAFIRYTLDLKEFWGSALDYSSYTKIKLFAPYCGIYDLNVDDFMDGSIIVEYKVDILSGTCLCQVTARKTQKTGTRLDSVLYNFNGNVFNSVPLSSTDWRGYFSSMINIASMAIAPSPSSVAGMAQEVMAQKVSVQKSGSIGSNYGFMGVQTPYLIIERPVQSLPRTFGEREGYPSNISRKVNTLSGYFKVSDQTAWSNNFECTDEEMQEIKSLLQEGVYR